ncbi:MAG TPA: tetratricopeptide repeat protein [Rhodopila sp.]|nr:tetratricopeptide repeat protein [Rhodopila sp.]
MDTMPATADADSLRNRAARLIDAGRPDAARPLLAAARLLAPPSPDLALTAARLAMHGGAWDEALQELDRGIEAAPTHAGLRKCRADVRQRIGDRDGAARDAAEAVINDPADPQAKALLGATLLDLGRVADAVSCLKEAVAGAPDDLDFRQALSTALLKDGDPETALLVLTDGIERAPGRIAIRNAAMRLCLRRRDFLPAVRFAEQARSLGIADATTFAMQGHALSSLGQHDAAAIAYQDALKLGPEDPYVRHLVVASGAIPDSKRAPAGFVRKLFDDYADEYETQVIGQGYRIPGAIRSVLQAHPKLTAGLTLGSVLDLGCGTGLAALAIGDLPLGPFTGVDLSPRMLAQARAKHLYQDLREADILDDLAADTRRWTLIIAADALCYFGALEDVLDAVHRSLDPDGWFVFSVEAMLPDHDGVTQGDGNWVLHRQGRYAHAEHYVYEAVCAAGFRVLRLDRPVVRQEAGADIPGLLFAVSPIRHGD